VVECLLSKGEALSSNSSIAKTKKSIVEDMEKLQSLYIAGGNVKW
jgi:hypothetical protein